ncbi:hypothetical protein K491DRAFT_682862 [Lophiostoma macrostomum CBS 122681]|uniref:F-box domain-containing protein n=1 Tax=Lophiostoma macrostomum CBS 122681 TaxID=1314788 RepID=A0A6A6SU93_9PLEO|nr:hypothetical protein K491DRAFT_682862 [Lophiostoma macrostomum CBS 122681]
MNRPFRLLDLPSELRLMIYERLPRRTKYHKVHLANAAGGQSYCLLAIKSAPISILATCRQIHTEAQRPVADIINDFILATPPELTIHENGDARVRTLTLKTILNGIQLCRIASMATMSRTITRAQAVDLSMKALGENDIYKEQRIIAPHMFTFIHQAAIYRLRAPATQLTIRPTIADLTHPPSRLLSELIHPGRDPLSESVDAELTLLLRYVGILWAVYHDEYEDTRAMINVHGLWIGREKNVLKHGPKGMSVLASRTDTPHDWVYAGCLVMKE